MTKRIKFRGEYATRSSTYVEQTGRLGKSAMRAFAPNTFNTGNMDRLFVRMVFGIIPNMVNVISTAENTLVRKLKGFLYEKDLQPTRANIDLFFDVMNKIAIDEYGEPKCPKDWGATSYFKYTISDNKVITVTLLHGRVNLKLTLFEAQLDVEAAAAQMFDSVVRLTMLFYRNPRETYKPAHCSMIRKLPDEYRIQFQQPTLSDTDIYERLADFSTNKSNMRVPCSFTKLKEFDNVYRLAIGPGSFEIHINRPEPNVVDFLGVRRPR